MRTSLLLFAQSRSTLKRRYLRHAGVLSKDDGWTPREKRRAAALVALLAIAFNASTAFATFPGANGLITYSAANPANSVGIFGVLPDGSKTERLTGPHTFDPSWSASGRKLLCVRDLNPNGKQRRFDIFIRRSDGSDRRVTNTRVNETDPSFSLGGNRIVFRAPGRPAATLVSTRLDGTHRHRLTATGPYPVSSPEYSPDGKHIVYSYRDAIWTSRADFSGARRVTPAPVRDFAPDYAPDGDQIVLSGCSISAARCYPWTDLVRPDGTHRHHAPCGTWGPSQLHVAVFAPGDDRTFASAKHTKLAVGSIGPCTFHELPVKGTIGDLAWQPMPTGVTPHASNPRTLLLPRESRSRLELPASPPTRRYLYSLRRRC